MKQSTNKPECGKREVYSSELQGGVRWGSTLHPFSVREVREALKKHFCWLRRLRRATWREELLGLSAYPVSYLGPWAFLVPLPIVIRSIFILIIESDNLKWGSKLIPIHLIPIPSICLSPGGVNKVISLISLLLVLT